MVNFILYIYLSKKKLDFFAYLGNLIVCTHNFSFYFL